MIRFHLDESAHGRIATALRHRGIDATISADVELVSASDERQLAFARGENRVLAGQPQPRPNGPPPLPDARLHDRRGDARAG